MTMTVIGEKHGIRLVLDVFGSGIPILRRETADGRILAVFGIWPEHLPGLITALQEMQGGGA
jgi:hypothetical protein